MRMVPINTEMPKGLIEVNGEPLIMKYIGREDGFSISDFRRLMSDVCH